MTVQQTAPAQGRDNRPTSAGFLVLAGIPTAFGIALLAVGVILLVVIEGSTLQEKLELVKVLLDFAVVCLLTGIGLGVLGILILLDRLPPRQ